MNTAEDITHWPTFFKPTEWPEGTLKHMTASLFENCVFPLRRNCGFSMWPSSLFDAHVRIGGNPKNRHTYIEGKKLSDATDLHVKTYANMVKSMVQADRIVTIGGIGVYFDTNTPMIHVDNRPERLAWLRTAKGEYVYRENDPVRFYKVLGAELAAKGV